MRLPKSALVAGLLLGWGAVALVTDTTHEVHRRSPKTTCTVKPGPSGVDSAPAIVSAFTHCKTNGHVIFENTTYHVASVMNTSGLLDTVVSIHGTLLWNNTNTTYWLNHSLPVGYQNQSTAWILGGNSIHVQGFGYGTLNGNGQSWYDLAGNISNYPRRPHLSTIFNTHNSVFEGIRFVNAQMWTTTVIHSSNVLMQDIYVNNTSNNPGYAPAINTDGVDTIYADNITFRRWDVTNGDDAISQKANSTNILMEDCIFRKGSLGVAVGSIGQYNGIFERIENVTATNITCDNCRYPAYIKTWTGITKGYPPNGGGGGLGYVQNLTLRDFKLSNATESFFITQCTSYNGLKGACDTSKFNIHGVTLEGWSGSVWNTSVAASMQCSNASPCHGIDVVDFELVDGLNGTRLDQWLCDSVKQQTGFNCTGPVVLDNPAQMEMAQLDIQGG